MVHEALRSRTRLLNELLRNRTPYRSTNSGETKTDRGQGIAGPVKFVQTFFKIAQTCDRNAGPRYASNTRKESTMGYGLITSSSRFSPLVINAALVTTLFLLPAMGQTNNDSDFVRKASAGGLAEVQLGQLAQQKASSLAVREFGKQMVNDHSKANDELKSIASKQGMSVSTSMDSKSQALYDKLSAMNGKEFDSAYISAMVKDHKEDIAEFQKESGNGQNAAIKAFASSTLPTLKEHLSMAQSASRQVESGSPASTGSH